MNHYTLSLMILQHWHTSLQILLSQETWTAKKCITENTSKKYSIHYQKHTEMFWKRNQASCQLQCPGHYSDHKAISSNSHKITYLTFGSIWAAFSAKYNWRAASSRWNIAGWDLGSLCTLVVACLSVCVVATVEWQISNLSSLILDLLFFWNCR